MDEKIKMEEKIEEVKEEATPEFNEEDLEYPGKMIWRRMKKACAEHPEYVTEAVKSFMYGAIGLSVLGGIHVTKKLIKTETRYKKLWVENEKAYQAGLKK